MEKDATAMAARPLAARIYSLAQMLRRSAGESYLKSLGVGTTEWPILATVAAGPISFRELSERLNRDKAQVSRDVASLIRRGYIVKSKSPHDSRQVVIGLNMQDSRVVSEVQRVTDAREERLVEGLSAADRQKLGQLLERVYENARSPRMLDI